MVGFFKPLTGEYMKSFVLKTVVASLAVVSSAMAAQTPEKCTGDECFKYKNRLSASPNSVSYERLGDDSVYVGFEYAQSPTLVRSWVRPATIETADLKAGYTFAFDSKLRLTPFIGGNYFYEAASYQYFRPTLAHGTFGFNAEYDVVKPFTIGLNVDGMVGGRLSTMVNKEEDTSKEASWGLHAAVPVTVRFGSSSQWDARFEPFTYVLKDYANYVGGKASVGYRW